MSAPITINTLIDQVRDQLDEDSTITISDSDILQALNRAQDYATDLMIRHYPDPLVTNTTINFVAGQEEYDLPEDIFEDRLQKVEVLVSGIAWEVKRISYRDVTSYESDFRTTRPIYYYILGKKLYLIPTPSGGSATLRYWYLRELDTLVESEGRITSINTGSNYIVVDSLGDNLTTVSDELKNYVNIVDAQTGIVKVSLQIENIDTSQNRIYFKSTPDRTSVYNRTISSEIGTEVEVDDFVCLSTGSCIPYLKKPLSNYIIQHAVVAIKRRLGEATEAEERFLAKFEDQMESQWSGREHQLRVKKRSRNWFSPFRRYFTNY